MNERDAVELELEEARKLLSELMPCLDQTLALLGRTVAIARSAKRARDFRPSHSGADFSKEAVR
jgi:hypothetical protein